MKNQTQNVNWKPGVIVEGIVRNPINKTDRLRDVEGKEHQVTRHIGWKVQIEAPDGHLIRVMLPCKFISANSNEELEIRSGDKIQAMIIRSELQMQDIQFDYYPLAEKKSASHTISIDHLTKFLERASKDRKADENILSGFQRGTECKASIDSVDKENGQVFFSIKDGSASGHQTRLALASLDRSLVSDSNFTVGSEVAAKVSHLFTGKRSRVIALDPRSVALSRY